ncbi:major facilitator superfamily domain-containing protein [Aspergillus crustosus]
MPPEYQPHAQSQSQSQSQPHPQPQAQYQDRASNRLSISDLDSDEDIPFLSHPDQYQDDHDHDHHTSTSSSTRNGNAKESPGVVIDGAFRFRFMLTLFSIVLAVEVGYVMAGGPMTRIYESIVCTAHYTATDPSKIDIHGQVPEVLCKGKEVQSEVAAVKGYMEFFEGVLSVILAAPYGLLADRLGRRKALCLGIPGFILNCFIMLGVMWFSDLVSLRWVWASCLAYVFGGGPVVTMAVVFTMMADVTTEEERAMMFFRFGIVSMAADFISSASSSWLMVLNPWIPLLIGYGVVIVGVFMALLLPETKDAVTPVSFENEHTHAGEMELDPLSSTEGEKLTTAPVNDNDHPDAPFITRSNGAGSSFFASAAIMLKSSLTPYAFIFRSKRVLLLLTAFLVYRLSRGSSWFLTQYISARYNWTLASANLLVSFKPALTIPLFLFVIPYISTHFFAGQKSALKDLKLARASILFLVLGTLGIGLSPSIGFLIPSLITQTLGSGFAYLARSLITTLVKREETARLFTVIEVLQAIGNVIASLSITTVFQIGLAWGGGWVGLAWMMTSSAFCLVGLAIWSFEVPGERDKEVRVEHGD